MVVTVRSGYFDRNPEMDVDGELRGENEVGLPTENYWTGRSVPEQVRAAERIALQKQIDLMLQ